MDRVSRLLLFVDVVEAGSFSAAARRRHATRAAVARQIAGLEDQLGSRLLHRSTRRMSVTDLGQRVYEHALRVRDETRAIRALAEEAHDAITGTLRVTSVVHFGRRYVQPVVKRFVRDHPRLDVDLRLEDRFENLVGAGFDLGIRIGKPVDSTLIGRRIADVDVLICAAPAYLERRGVPKTPGDLAGHDCLVYASDEVVVDRWAYIESGRTHFVHVDSRYRVNHGELLMDAVIDGLGIALLPRFLAAEALDRGELAVVLGDLELPSYAPLHAVYPARQHLPKKTRAFIDALVAFVGDPPRWTQKKNGIDAKRDGRVRGLHEPIR